MKKHILTALKGFGMGAANVIPGVSGGTIALLTGIYSPIVDAISSVTDIRTWKALLSGRFPEFWKRINGSFLLALGVGLVLSVFSLAKLATYTLTFYPVQTWAFFFGLIVASALMMIRDVSEWGIPAVMFIAVGIAAGIVVCTLSPTHTTEDLWFIFVCGVIAICTMILPGISGSFILLIMGKYDYIMQALADVNVPVLAVFAAGCVVGILAFARLLKFLLSRWESQTMLVLLGFVLGSLVKVWPWADMDAVAKSQSLPPGAPVDLHIPGAIIWCVAGIALVFVLEFFGKKNTLQYE